MVQTNNETGITRALGNFARELEYEDLSPEVIDWAKYLCLDFAAVTLNGSTTDSAQAVVDALQRLGRPGPSVIAGTRHRVLPEYASMANGIAFHSIEMDDVNNEASLHPGVVAFPDGVVDGGLGPRVRQGLHRCRRRRLRRDRSAGQGATTCRALRTWLPSHGHLRCIRRGSGGRAAAGPAGRRLHPRPGNRGKPDRRQHGIPGAGGVDQAIPPRMGLAQRLPGLRCWPVPATPARRPSSRAATGSCRPIPGTRTTHWCCRTWATSI